MPFRGFSTNYNIYFKIVPESGSLELNPILMKDDPEHWASAYDFGIHPNVYYPAYHSGSDIYSLLSALENQYPDSAEFHGGDDLVSMAIHWLKISQHVRIFHCKVSVKILITRLVDCHFRRDQISCRNNWEFICHSTNWARDDREHGQTFAKRLVLQGSSNYGYFI